MKSRNVKRIYGKRRGFIAGFWCNFLKNIATRTRKNLKIRREIGIMPLRIFEEMLQEFRRKL